jgi:hypothetical protein
MRGTNVRVLVGDAHKEGYCPICCGTWCWTVYFVGSIMHIIRRRATQKGKFVSTLCYNMQGALSCVDNWCREIGLSVNAYKTTIVLLTNNSKIGGFYNPIFFGTELRMTEQVKYLRVILDKKPDWKAHLENKMCKACIAYW